MCKRTDGGRGYVCMYVCGYVVESGVGQENSICSTVVVAVVYMTQYDRNRWYGCVCEEQSIWIQREEREETAVDHFKDLCVGRHSHLRDLKLH